jgi:hypothetical protein
MIYYTQNNEISIYNYSTMSAETQQLPVSNALQALFYRNKITILLQDGSIWIYNL